MKKIQICLPEEGYLSRAWRSSDGGCFFDSSEIVRAWKMLEKEFQRCYPDVEVLFSDQEDDPLTQLTFSGDCEKAAQALLRSMNMTLDAIWIEEQEEQEQLIDEEEESEEW